MGLDFKQDENRPETNGTSCEPSMSRKDFVAFVVRRATIAGAIVAAPKIIDKFLVPPGLAASMSSGTGATETGMAGKEP